MEINLGETFLPLHNSEQMYQALKSLEIDTQLVVYPGQSHSISKPSYQRDVLERYLAWYDKYLTPSTASPIFEPKLIKKKSN